jgi:hypothetical protein
MKADGFRGCGADRAPAPPLGEYGLIDLLHNKGGFDIRGERPRACEYWTRVEAYLPFLLVSLALMAKTAFIVMKV